MEDSWLNHTATTCISDLYNATIPSTLHNDSNMTEASQLVSVISLTGSVVGILSIVFNILFLVCMRLLKDHSMPFYILMQNMSMADILSSLFFLLTHNWPQGPFATIDRTKSLLLVHGLPYVFRSTPWMFFTVYLLTLTAMTFTHYVAVCKPWRYSEVCEKGFIRKVLLGVWLVSSLQILLPILVLISLCALTDKHKAMTILFRVSGIEIQVWMVVFAVCTVMNFILDVVVYQKIKRLQLKRRNYSYSSQETRNIRSKHEAFITVSFLIITTIICRLPLPLMGIVGFNLARIVHRNGLYIINAVVTLLLYCNFLTDPLIYVLRMRDIRKSLVRMISYCVPSTRREIGPKCVNSSLRLRLLEVNIEQSQQREHTKHADREVQTSDEQRKTPSSCVV